MTLRVTKLHRNNEEGDKDYDEQLQDDELSHSVQSSDDESSLQVNLDELEQFYSDKDD